MFIEAGQIRVDNGPGFISLALSQWCQEHKVDLRFIDRGKPMQNGHAESFNGRMRDECLSMHIFHDLRDAERKIGGWWREYNYERPQLSGVNYFSRRPGVLIVANHK